MNDYINVYTYIFMKINLINIIAYSTSLHTGNIFILNWPVYLFS